VSGQTHPARRLILSRLTTAVHGHVRWPHCARPGNHLDMFDMKADPLTDAGVMHVLSRVVELASSGDVDGAMALFADDPDVFLLGTGVDEARTGHTAIREQMTRDLSQADTVSWILSPQSISAAGSVAWTSGDVVVRVSESRGGRRRRRARARGPAGARGPGWDRHASLHGHRGAAAEGPATRGLWVGSPCCASTTRSCALRSRSTVASR
jgi:hypothetical protein